jgi:hypothetical protein
MTATTSTSTSTSRHLLSESSLDLLRSFRPERLTGPASGEAMLPLLTLAGFDDHDPGMPAILTRQPRVFGATGCSVSPDFGEKQSECEEVHTAAAQGCS